MVTIKLSIFDDDSPPRNWHRAIRVHTEDLDRAKLLAAIESCMDEILKDAKREEL